MTATVSPQTQPDEPAQAPPPQQQPNTVITWLKSQFALANNLSLRSV